MLRRRNRRIFHILIFTLLCVIIPICYSFYFSFYPSSVSENKASKIIAKDYCPSKYGTVITAKLAQNPTGTTSYANYVTQKYAYEDISSLPGKTISQHKYVVKDGNFVFTPLIINLTNEKIKINSPSQSGTYGDLNIISLNNKPKWMSQDTYGYTATNYMESVDETISTRAGTFNNCIKVTTVFKSNHKKPVYLTSYYAKGLGIILLKKGPSLINQESLFELYSYYIPEKEWDKDNQYPIYTLINNDSKDEDVFKRNEMNIEFPIPDSFKGNYKVDNTVWQDNIESCINISFDYTSLVYQPISSIVKLKKGYGVDYINNAKKMMYLGEYDGYTYCYIISNAPNVNVYSDSNLTKKYNDMIDSICKFYNGNV